MSTPKTMRAVLVEEGRGLIDGIGKLVIRNAPEGLAQVVKYLIRRPIENLHISETPVPVLKTHEVLVNVKAFGLNRMDIYQRMGLYAVPPGASQILGVEFSGTVAEVGESVHGWSPGDEVFGLAAGCAYAEYVAVPHGNLMRKPSSLSWVDAASIPEAFITEFQALVEIAELQKGESVLVHAGASGVWVAANQLARFLGAKNVITTAGTDGKLEWLRTLGVTHAVNYKKEDFSQTVKQATDSRGVDVVIDFVGKSHWEKNISALGMDGRMVLLAVLGVASRYRVVILRLMPAGATVPNVNLMPIIFKRLRIQGSTLRSRSEEYQAKLVQRFHETIVPHLTGKDGQGEVKTFVHKLTKVPSVPMTRVSDPSEKFYSWTDIQAVTREMEASANIGKIVVEVV